MIKNNPSPFGKDPSLRPEGRHDAYFKLNMRDPEFARQFFLWAIPELKNTVLDMDRLNRVSESFLDNRLKESFADILFQVPIKDSESDGKGQSELELCVFFLVEHKSRSERQTAFQIFRYMTRIWEEWVSNNEARSDPREPLLPFVLPIIFYHGKHKYSGPVNIRDSIRSIPCLEKYLPDWQLCLIDVSQVSDTQLPKYWKLRALIRMTRGIFHKNLLETFRIINKEVYPHIHEPGARQFLNPLVNYGCLSAAEVSSEIIEEVSKMESFEDLDYELLPWWKKEQIAHGIALIEREAKGRAEGEAKGRAEGEAKGRIEGRVEGRVEGHVEGLAEGRVEGKIDQLLFVLTKRFGELPTETAAAIKNIKEITEIDRLFDLSLDIPTLSEFIAQLR